MDENQVTGEAEIKKKKSLLPVIIIVVAVAIICVVVYFMIFSQGAKDAREIKLHLANAEKYLNDFDYESAIAEYEAALKLKPEEKDTLDAYVDAVLEYAEIVGEDDPEKAVEILAGAIKFLENIADGYVGIDKLKEKEEEYRLLVATDSDEDGNDSDDNTSKDDETEPDDTSFESYINDEGYFVLGTFEQDGDESNGPEPIEWMVLADEDGKKLLLSRYILMPVGNLMEFPGDGVKYSWKECGIREYLNGEFYESTFTDEERELIAETEIRTTWSDESSMGDELVDVETISWEFVGQIYSRDVGKIITTDKIFIPDFDEEFVKYMKVHRDIYESFGTDILAKATPASGLENYPYEQQIYDWEKDYIGYNDYDPENVNLDESLVGESFGGYILRTGISAYGPVLSEDGSSTGESVRTACYYIVCQDAAMYYPPYWLTEFPFHTDYLGIRPMMWVYAE